MSERVNYRFSGLLEAVPDATICVDGQGIIRLANAQAERLFGYCQDDLLGQPVEILIPESVRGVHPGHRAAYMADPAPRPMGAEMELAGRRCDGSTFPAEISLAAIDTDTGPLVTAAVRDVSDRLRMTEATARLASIIQSSHDAVIGKTLDLTVTSWNPAAERLYGYSAEEMIGEHIQVLFPGGELERERAVLAAVVRGERVEEHQTHRIRKDGSTVAVSITVSPIMSVRGEVVGVSTIARDVSERQRAEARFFGLLEAAPDAMVCVDSTGRIALMNTQAERLFGYERDDIVGQPVEVLVPEQVRAHHPAHRADYVAESRPRPMGAGMELAGRRRDGSTFPAEISLSAIETDDGVLVTAAVRDVTEQRAIQAERERLRTLAERDRLERQLEQSQRLESLGQLAGGVAHDFNNLLGVISSYADFVAEQLRNPEAAEPGQSALADIEEVRHAAKRGSALTHQLLAFARREVVQPQVLDLNKSVGDILSLLRRTLGEHIELSTELAPDLALVLVDPGHVEQILVNLAVNARDAMVGGGCLIIKTSKVDVDEAYAGGRADMSPGRYVALRVSDNGPGMPPEIVERAFEPFFTTKPKGEGTGLGLATIYGIVRQAGGNVRIYSEPGLGTTITVLLPVTDETADGAGRSVTEPDSQGNGELLLVVEDEAALREVARRILSRNGYRVMVASNGQQAIDAARASADRIDGLVTDVIMPGMQGRELADRLRAVQPDLAVLYMSGYTQGILGAQGVLDAGVALIEKPFSEETLLSGLRAVFSRRSSAAG